RIFELLERLTRGYPLVPWKPLLRSAALSRGLTRGHSVVASCLLVARPGRALVDASSTARQRHHNATHRAYIQKSAASNEALAHEFGIHRRRARPTVPPVTGFGA